MIEYGKLQFTENKTLNFLPSYQFTQLAGENLLYFTLHALPEVP